MVRGLKFAESKGIDMSHKPRKQAADLKHGPTPDSDDDVMQLLDELRSNPPEPVQPTSGDYAMGYAEGFNDGCKPVQPKETP